MSAGFVYKRRLLRLAELLEKLPPHRFDFGHWAGTDWEGAANLSCGTTACALGWATSIPAFRRLGLHLYDRGGRPWVGIGDDTKETSPQHAGWVVFGLDETEFNFLFVPWGDQAYSEEGDDIRRRFKRPSPDRSSTAKEVAKNIRWFVNHKYGVS